jgi:hypothetical protein
MARRSILLGVFSVAALLTTTACGCKQDVEAGKYCEGQEITAPVASLQITPALVALLRW